MSSKQQAKPPKCSAAKARKSKPLPSDLDAEYFAERWNASATLKALALQLGVSAATCATVAARLRESGYVLKWFRKGRPRLFNL